MTIYQPYTYLIGWSKINKWYYGVRYSQKCMPSDLWVTYFTSSKIVKQLRLDHGEPDIIQVRKTFDCQHKALRWESSVLRKMNVLVEEKWLNQNVSGDHFVIKKHSDETKQKMRANNASKRPEMRAAASKRQSGENNSFYGKTHTEETIAKIRSSLTGFKRPDSFAENRKGQGNAFYGKQHTEESKLKMKAFQSNRSIVQCPHCKKSLDKANAMRWHFDNCKFTSEFLEG